LEILFSGETRWVNERDYQAERGWKHNLSRLVSPGEYPALEALGKLEAYRDMGLAPPEPLRAKISGLKGVQDSFAVERAWLETLRGALPQESRYRTLLARHRLGWYVPEGRIMPLGDNRDNSRDGRYFGPVRLSKVLGNGSLIYWPLWRGNGMGWRAGLIR
jgi:signal peptidase I